MSIAADTGSAAWSCPTCQVRDESPCLDRRGRPRHDHVKRRLVAKAHALLERHAHQLPLDDRLRLAASLLRPLHEESAHSTTATDAHEAELIAPNWAKLWQRLLAASNIIEKVREALIQPDSGLNFHELSTDLQNLHSRIESAYRLCCTEPWLDDLLVRPGIDLAELESLVAIRHAERVDTALRQRIRIPEDTTSDWTITYHEHGGFVARANRPITNPAGPDEFGGFASTPLAAADLISQWFTGQATAHMTFDPPAPEKPKLASGGEAPDMIDYVEVHRHVLQHGGLCYQQLRDACAATREHLRGVDISQLLAQRATLLNNTDPHLPNDPKLPIGAPHNDEQHHKASLSSACWVPTRLIVSTGHPWGNFDDHRPQMLGQIAKELASDVDLDQFLVKFFPRGGEINLVHIPAWAGPLYQCGINGNHRIHIATILNLPWLCATVNATAIGTEFSMISLCHNDIDNPLPWFSDDNYDQRVALLAGMINRGIINGQIVIDDPSRPRYTTTLRCRYLPAPWLLRNPHYTVRVNASYEYRYPGALTRLNIPLEIGTHADKWVQWLTKPDN